jgi:saccharopine dehydrogenase-like protein
MPNPRPVVVYGAYGHTGRFVVAELLRRGFEPILGGRDAARLETLRREHPGTTARAAAVEDREALDRMLAGTRAVLNCAGPFVDTSAAILEAAIRGGVPYLDVAAEQSAVLAAFELFDDAARERGVLAVPGMAFYGGFGDLFATAAVDGWDEVDEITLAIALDHWWPTRGTRLTGERNPGQRLVYRGGRLERGDPFPPRSWTFPPPFGAQQVVGLQLAETILIPRHLRTSDVRVYLNRVPIDDLHDASTPPPQAVDASGRSAQIFVVEVLARRGREERRAMARGRDIYAFTAPLVVEAMKRVLAGEAHVAAGVVAPGEVFDARAFLEALRPELSALELRGSQ